MCSDKETKKAFINALRSIRIGTCFPEHFHDNKCPDKYVGRVKDNLNCPRFVRSDDIAKMCDFRRRIILVLESPHILEYESTNSPMPACGYTGSRIRKCWMDVFGEEFNDFDLILMNAVQYQCSLGFSPLQPEIRDYVFMSTFTGACKCCFVDRVNSYYRENDIIVLATTDGVRAAVRESLSGGFDAEVPHPASWRSEARIVSARKLFRQTYKSAGES